MARDPALALAKLRMDLELELAEVGKSSGLFDAGVPFNPSIVFSLLVERKVLPIELQPVWKEVYQACNKAIHGHPFDRETAESIVRVGVQLARTIRQSRLGKAAPSSKLKK
jgi:hypothetical protein